MRHDCEMPLDPIGFELCSTTRLMRCIEVMINDDWVTCWAVRQFVFGDVCHSLEVIVTGVTEVRRAEAEEDGHGAAVATFVLQEIRAVFGAHLQTHNPFHTNPKLSKDNKIVSQSSLDSWFALSSGLWNSFLGNAYTYVYINETILGVKAISHST